MREIFYEIYVNDNFMLLTTYELLLTSMLDTLTSLIALNSETNIKIKAVNYVCSENCSSSKAENEKEEN